MPRGGKRDGAGRPKGLGLFKMLEVGAAADRAILEDASFGGDQEKQAFLDKNLLPENWETLKSVPLKDRKLLRKLVDANEFVPESRMDLEDAWIALKNVRRILDTGKISVPMSANKFIEAIEDDMAAPIGRGHSFPGRQQKTNDQIFQAVAIEMSQRLRMTIRPNTVKRCYTEYRKYLSWEKSQPIEE